MAAATLSFVVEFYLRDVECKDDPSNPEAPETLRAKDFKKGIQQSTILSRIVLIPNLLFDYSSYL